MNVKTPTLRQLADGRWYTSWGGRRHYFGRQREKAVRRYTDSIAEWTAWRHSHAERTGARRCERKPSVLEIYQRFAAAKLAEGGKNLESYYRKQLRRFVNIFGSVPAERVRAIHVHELRTSMLNAGYAPKTINHDTACAKTMLRWAMDLELIPEAPLRAIRAIPLPPPPDKAMSLEEVRGMIRNAPEPVRSWLAVNYLTLARPVEVVRLVRREGTWTDHGIFRLTVSKTQLRTKQPRHLVCSDLALAWLSCCLPRWSRLDSYSHAVRAACGPGGPHRLRHSAATHLAQSGAARADVDLLLGHMPSRVSVIYCRVEFAPLRELAARLSL